MGIIGVGTGRAGGPAPPPPQYFTLETLLIFIHAAQITAIAEYITFGPPNMELLPTPSYGNVVSHVRLYLINSHNCPGFFNCF